jgi:hypothetical protein
VKKNKQTNSFALKEGMCGYGMTGCCMSSCGIVHFIGGIGVAFLLVEYFGLMNLLGWGWVLVIVAVLGHMMKKNKWML